MNDDDEDDALPLPPRAELYELSADLALLALPNPEAALPPPLTPVEQDIVLRVYAGATNEQIARERNASVKTVGNQLEAIFKKLNVGSRYELVRLLRGQAR